MRLNGGYMVDFKGEKCVACNNEFKEGDNIVVCPECGSPYHKECYANNGKCVNEKLHKTGGSWEPHERRGGAFALREAGALTKCPGCSHNNPSGLLYCEKCGMAIGIADSSGRSASDEEFRNRNSGLSAGMHPFLINFSDPLCGFNPEESFDGGVKMSELADFVDNNTHYYLPVFKRIKELKVNLSVNLAAMLVPELYFANRKMVPYAFLALAVRFFFQFLPQFAQQLSVMSINLGAISEIVGRLNTESGSFTLLTMLSQILFFVFSVYCGFKANWIYFKKSLKKIIYLKSITTLPKLRGMLRRRGGTSALTLALFVCLMMSPWIVMQVYSMFGGIAAV